MSDERLSWVMTSFPESLCIKLTEPRARGPAESVTVVSYFRSVKNETKINMNIVFCDICSHYIKSQYY